MRTSSDIAIEAHGLGKQYLIGGRRSGRDTLREVLAASVRGLVRRGARPAREKFWALSDVGFEIRQGENVGVLGLNGAGKSTLLKVLSRVTDPTTGWARVNGRLGSLLEVGTGFHSELTGRENVFLYGAILGMSRSEIARKFDAIVAFAEIEEFIDTPVKRYSSGMYVRLAFAVAAHLEPDILLLDEVLSVGDLPFQRKCIEFARDLQKRRATILFVSHNMFSIKSMCERVIYLRRGQVAYDGPAEAGIELYEADCRLAPVSWAGDEGTSAPIAISDVRLMDEAGAPKAVFDHGERMRVRLDYETRAPIDAPNFIIAFVRSDGVPCCNFSTELDGLAIDGASAGGRIELLTPPLSLVAESYRIEVLVREKGFQRLVCGQIGGAFHVRDPLLDVHFGVFHEAGEWSCQSSQSPAQPRATGAAA